MGIRAALYTRVSTEDQAKDGFSLDAQKKFLLEHCVSRGLTPVGVYVDEGYSGRSVDRPAYQEMMAAMDQWDVLLVLKMDRIHRNSMNFTLMMNHLRENGKDFTSTRDKFDTSTAIGRFVMDIIQRIAQLESEQIGERVKIGMEQKARTGTGHLGSGHPYGYYYDNGKLEVDLDEALTVRAIYRMHSKGSSLNDIAKTLNDANIPAKKGGQWNKQSVHKILHNLLYTGYMKWDTVVRPGEHTPIISLQDFEEVNGPLAGTDDQENSAAS